MTNAFLDHSRASVPVICGAMYPCSNPELVAAVSEAGGLGVIQPLSLAYVHSGSFEAGLARVRELTKKPVGFNAIVEKTVPAYERRMRAWIEAALESDVRFFVTALGDPRWVCDLVHQVGGFVYHDVTERRFAEKALQGGVDGFICVNDRAGGHAGRLDPRSLFDEIAPLGRPLVCAGGVGDEDGFLSMLSLGYEGVQMGTRFIATPECAVHEDYRRAIVEAGEEDVVLTDKLSGVDVSVLRNADLDRAGYRAGPLARRLLRHRRTKHWMRTWYALRSLRSLKRSIKDGLGYRDVWQAGKSVEGVHSIEPAVEIVARFGAAWERAQADR